ncbi:glutathione S-transferase family protein [Glaciecola siphonariae]|uniref:Glutathione S-transferase family protein n=1 Tax=Glaciecola siphonariae TaxID=521012 RepID=A0ABV9LX89_9ALTE
MMKLYGSKPSPYVRRLRMLMAKLDFEFVVVDVYAPADRAMLVKHNPTLKIPMLDDNGQIVLDSGVIYQYLASKGQADALSVAQQNHLSAIEAATDSFVNLFLLKRSNVDTDQDALYFRLQRERIAAVFDSLESAIESKDFARWDFLTMTLFALLDWIIYRELYKMDNYPKLCAFVDRYARHEDVISTDPR